MGPRRLVLGRGEVGLDSAIQLQTSGPSMTRAAIAVAPRPVRNSRAAITRPPMATTQMPNCLMVVTWARENMPRAAISTSSVASPSSRRIIGSAAGLAQGVRFQGRDRADVQNAARGGALDHHVDRLAHAEQQRPDRQAVGAGLEQGEGDVGGV